MNLNEWLPNPARNKVGAYHRGAGDTEREAARMIAPNSGTARARVLDAIAFAPATDEELSLRLEMRLYTAAPRRNELLRDGWIQDSGKRRLTTTGSRAVVWELSPEGREQIQ